MVAERGYTQALPVEDFLVGQLRDWTSVGRGCSGGVLSLLHGPFKE